MFLSKLYLNIKRAGTNTHITNRTQSGTLLNENKFTKQFCVFHFLAGCAVMLSFLVFADYTSYAVVKSFGRY